jgi:hypothetical protein
MPQEPHPASLFTQVDITAGAPFSRPREQQHGWSDDQTALLRSILAAQDRQNELLEELINQVGQSQRQRNAELSQWKQTNPHLAASCRQAAEALSKVQIEFLNTLTNEVSENADVLMDGEFMLNEFVDRFGPRLAHLNGVLQVLAQLSSAPNPAGAAQS